MHAAPAVAGHGSMNAALWPMAEVLPFARPRRDGDRRPWHAIDQADTPTSDPDDGPLHAAEEMVDLDDVTDVETAPGAALGAAGTRRDAPAAALDDAAMATLIARIVDRDERALETLYDATSRRVYGLALRITRRQALAEEVVEDTYWQAWRQAPRFDALRGRAMTWLLAMARSRAIDAQRRDERFRHEELPDESVLDSEAAAPPQDLLDASSSSAALHAAVLALDAKARQLVSLAFFRGLTHEEIAAQERMPLGSVKSLIRRSLQQLRRALEAAGNL